MRGQGLRAFAICPACCSVHAAASACPTCAGVIDPPDVEPAAFVLPPLRLRLGRAELIGVGLAALGSVLLLGMMLS